MQLPDTYVGETCQAIVPILRDRYPDEAEEALRTATDALDAKCRQVGCVPANIALVSRKPWSEAPDMDLLTYQATAVEPG